MTQRKKPRAKKIAPGVVLRFPFWPKPGAVTTIKGTWFATDGIARSYVKGDTLPSLARAYGVKVAQIEDALRYELSRLVHYDETA